jgi:thiamine-phosphate pyrophosphorylase
MNAAQLSLYLVMSGRANRYNCSAVEIAEQALAGGVTILQYREKQLPMSEMLAIGKQLRALCQRAGVPFIVNDRIDVALLLAADGVHLGQEDIPLLEARKLLGQERIIGISTGTFAEAVEAERTGANYVGVGAIFATTTKKDAGEPIGTTLIHNIDAQLTIPQVGIGGIDISNAQQVMRAGAEGIAVVSAISEARDVRFAAQELKNLLV